ncbi:hypothetical protein DFH07DRAFT_744507 [Mycena maculata]|uniref:Uncharacterized protein n=1 Tax=Mycena maculata TaxID=230809 RepID=A0AAD7J0W4_9AGAR|nr:hypothetical protein DFH07DRAFT_744507 [Mycena maculata]
MLAGRNPGFSPDIYDLKLFFLEITAEAASYGTCVLAFPPPIRILTSSDSVSGVFLTVALISMYTLVKRGIRDSSARQALLGIMLTMLLGATLHLGLHLPYIILQVPTLTADDEDPTPILKKLDLAQTTLRRLIYFLSDVVVCWRAWAIWSDNLAVKITLAICLLATFATSLTLYIFNANTIESGHQYPTLTQNFFGTFCLLVTNTTATSLIGYKLWRVSLFTPLSQGPRRSSIYRYYRRNLKKYLNRGNRMTRVEGVLTLLLESGCILLMVGDFGYFQAFGFEWFQPNISGIYPTLVILVVSHRDILGEDVFAYAPTLQLGTLSGPSIPPLPDFQNPPDSGHADEILSNDSRALRKAASSTFEPCTDLEC